MDSYVTLYSSEETHTKPLGVQMSLTDIYPESDVENRISASTKAAQTVNLLSVQIWE